MATVRDAAVCLTSSKMRSTRRDRRLLADCPQPNADGFSDSSEISQLGLADFQTAKTRSVVAP
jgi:hypothetical protein